MSHWPLTNTLKTCFLLLLKIALLPSKEIIGVVAFHFQRRRETGELPWGTIHPSLSCLLAPPLATGSSSPTHLGTSAVCLGTLSPAGVLPDIPFPFRWPLGLPILCFSTSVPDLGIGESCDHEPGLWSQARMHGLTFLCLGFLVCEMGWTAALL